MWDRQKLCVKNNPGDYPLLSFSPCLRCCVQFLKEQAALSAEEITADTINDFIGDLNEEECDDDPYSSLDTCDTAYKNNGNPLSTSNGYPFDASQSESPSLKLKTNGAANGAVNGSVNWTMNGAVNGAVKGAGNGAVNGTVKGAVNGAGNGAVNGAAKNGFAKSLVRYIEDEARAGIEAWQADTIASWHTTGGGSVQWFSVCCRDRNSKLLFFTLDLPSSMKVGCSNSDLGPNSSYVPKEYHLRTKMLVRLLAQSKACACREGIHFRSLVYSLGTDGRIRSQVRI